MDGSEISKNCKRYFLETGDNTVETIILLDDAIQAINDNIKNKIIVSAVCRTHGVNMVYGKCPVCSDIERTTNRT